MNHNSTAYESAKQTLNSAQKKAVETVYGPVLAIAGPGTGKTQVLALRIAEILQETDTNPENILALTFTDAGVVAMRNRLRTFIGPTAHSVRISTFHGFCVETIARYPEYFSGSRFRVAADKISQIRILQKILESSDFTALSPATRPFFFLRNILSRISELKREGLSPEDFQQIVEQRVVDFETISEEEKTNPKTGHWKKKYLDEQKRIEKWQELVLAYKQYEDLMQKEGLMDFDDQILFVLHALRTEEDLTASVREETLFLLADEFQDSNGAQMEILERIVGDDQSPNIFTVGDDDQSIYRFQGANLENITRFLRKFSSATIIPLTENYRSTKEILALAESVIQNSSERLTKIFPKISKRIVSATKKKGEMPKLFSFSTPEAERFFVLQKAKNLHKKGYSLAEIAVLVRTNHEGQEFLRYFEENDLPAVFSSRSNVLRDIRIQQILTLLKLAENPTENRLFFEVLHYPVWNIPLVEIWRAHRYAKEQKTSLFECFLENHNSQLKDEERDPNSVSGSLKNSSEISDSANTAPNVVRICQLFGEWSQDLRDKTLPEVFQKILTESGFLAFLLGKKTRLETLNHVNALFGEIKTLARNTPNASLSHFLEILRIREEFDEPIEDRMLQAPTEAVRILTTHGAKGLEYETVFVTNLAEGVWGDRKKPQSLTLPEDIVSMPKDIERENEEERRLFFVAITRAKEQLFLSYSMQSETGKEQSASRFLDEIDPETREEGVRDIYEEQVEERLKSDLFFSPQKTSVDEESFLREMVHSERFALSPTAFENYRECPNKFLLENLLRIPSVKDARLSLGTAVHAALESFFTEHRKQKILPNRSIAFLALEKSFEREIISSSERDALLREGREHLNTYFDQFEGLFPLPVATELDFRPHHVLLDGTASITGKIDKVEWINEAQREVRIIDYKTSKGKSVNEILGARDSQKDDIRAGAMYRQLLFYFLLATESRQFPWTPISFALDFLRPDESGKCIRREFQISFADTLPLKEEIHRVWKSIQNLEFLETKEPCEIKKKEGRCWYCEIMRKNDN
ncbi:ATP-dependent helicase [Candidatus Peregrinibacteria bacterium]|nr:MAG: ATP-dependent helicase [Candidatus Peregrinibacteria bacterium]